MSTSPVTIGCKRLYGEVSLPRYHSKEAAGMDIQAFLGEGIDPISIPPLGRALVPTGICLQIPVGYEAQVRPRSGLALRHGITVLNSPGTIDSDYRGEILVLLVNLGNTVLSVHTGDRIAQLVIAPICSADVIEVSVLEETERGKGGYGHTGMR